MGGTSIRPAFGGLEPTVEADEKSEPSIDGSSHQKSVDTSLHKGSVALESEGNSSDGDSSRLSSNKKPSRRKSIPHMVGIVEMLVTNCHIYSDCRPKEQ